MLWGGRRVPFTLLGGYLGAGKTTIVNHVLGSAGGRRIVVLVNDVGAIDVDAALIADHDGTTLTLSNGCVCCAIADDFTATLEQVRSLPEAPDHVLMELSGVGEPARVAPWANTAGFVLDGVVVAADAEQIGGLVRHPYVGDTVATQLASADLILLTKVDLAADADRARAVVRHHSSAPILPVERGAVDVEVLLGVGRDGPVIDSESEPDVHRTSVLELGRLSRAELDAAIQALPASVMRAKGLVHVTDDEVLVEVQVVGHRRSTTRRPDLDLDADPNLDTGGLVVVWADPLEPDDG